jgi:hypothetical protein
MGHLHVSRAGPGQEQDGRRSTVYYVQHRRSRKPNIYIYMFPVSQIHTKKHRRGTDALYFRPQMFRNPRSRSNASRDAYVCHIRIRFAMPRHIRISIHILKRLSPASMLIAKSENGEGNCMKVQLSGLYLLERAPNSAAEQNRVACKCKASLNVLACFQFPNTHKQTPPCHRHIIFLFLFWRSTHYISGQNVPESQKQKQGK